LLATEYECDAVTAFTTVPSPKLMLVLAIVPSGSLDAAAEAFTLRGAVPLDGVAVSLATGGWLTGAVLTTTVAVADPLCPLLSVAVARTV
jgi:hypothetical protein